MSSADVAFAYDATGYSQVNLENITQCLCQFLFSAKSIKRISGQINEGIPGLQYCSQRYFLLSISKKMQ